MRILPDNTDNNIRNNIDKNHNINNKNIKINSCRNDDKNTRYNIKNNTTNNRNITTNNKNSTNDNNNNDNIKKNNNSNMNPDATATLSIGGGHYLEEVTQFKYLGSILSSDNSVDTEVEARINRAVQAFRTLSRLVWYQPKIKVQTKLKLFKAVIIPNLLYGSETWNLLQKHTQRLQVFVNRCLRIITGTSLWEKMRNTQLQSSSNIDRVEVMIQKRRLKWLGHLERMPDDRLPRRHLVSKIAGGKRHQGEQKQRWHDLVQLDLKKLNIVDFWRAKAHDRRKWRNNITKRLQELNREKELEEKL